jgi:hypothetical protein
MMEESCVDNYDEHKKKGSNGRRATYVHQRRIALFTSNKLAE